MIIHPFGGLAVINTYVVKGGAVLHEVKFWEV
jgi:hypothetical protein